MMAMQGVFKVEYCLALMALILCGGIQGQKSFNETCGPIEHCAINSGLICSNQTCKCGDGTVSRDVQGGQHLLYLMKWNEVGKVCVGMEGGACIGNKQNPVEGATQKKVQCDTGMECVQVTGLPLGVGRCTRDEFGKACGPNQHCAVGKGLICEKDRCQCANGTVTKTLKYTMRWDGETRECVAMAGGACIGNDRNPVDGNAMKRVRCENNLVCQQHTGLPPGVGVCQGDGTTTSTMPPTTTSTMPPTTTSTMPPTTTSTMPPTTTSTMPPTTTSTMPPTTPPASGTGRVVTSLLVISSLLGIHFLV